MTKFEQLIEKDIENGTFHSKNIYCKEYLQPMFFGYGINLEKENEQLKQENEQLKKQIKDLESQLKDVIEDNDYYQKENGKMKKYCDCEFCRHCDNELTNPETGKTICDICNDNNLWS